MKDEPPMYRIIVLGYKYTIWEGSTTVTHTTI